MRVISGSAKGKKLISSKSREIRPTSDKVKMAIFNILRHGVIDFDFDGCDGEGYEDGGGHEGVLRGRRHRALRDQLHQAHRY